MCAAKSDSKHRTRDPRCLSGISETRIIISPCGGSDGCALTFFCRRPCIHSTLSSLRDILLLSSSLSCCDFEYRYRFRQFGWNPNPPTTLENASCIGLVWRRNGWDGKPQQQTRQKNKTNQPPHKRKKKMPEGVITHSQSILCASIFLADIKGLSSRDDTLALQLAHHNYDKLIRVYIHLF